MGDRIALITGITGQDGAHPAELLLAKGYIVHGIKKRLSSLNTERIDHLYLDRHEGNRQFLLHDGDLADVLIGEVVGYTAGFAFDETKPDGTPRKLLDGRRLSGLGWRPRIGLRGGLRQTYAWFLENATSEMDNGYAGSASFQ